MAYGKTRNGGDDTKQRPSSRLHCHERSGKILLLERPSIAAQQYTFSYYYRTRSLPERIQTVEHRETKPRKSHGLPRDTEKLCGLILYQDNRHN